MATAGTAKGKNTGQGRIGRAAAELFPGYFALVMATGLNGAWLIAAVATQSVSVLGTLLSPHFADYREPLLFFTLCMYLAGCMLYLLLIALIFYRFTFVNLTSASLTPPYWINMGAVAITTLAGARLVHKRSPLRYGPQYWGMVFPLGMYTVCTIQLSRAINFEPLLQIPRFFIYLALAAWLAAFAGMLHALLFKRRP